MEDQGKKPAVSHWLRVDSDLKEVAQGERLEFCGWVPKPGGTSKIVFEVYAAGEKLVANISTPVRGWETTMEEVSKLIISGALVPISPPHDL